MAITPTVLYESGCQSSGSATFTTSSISPAANSVLVVNVCHMTTGGYTIDSISDTFSGSGTWTLRSEPAVVGSRVTRKVFDCQMGSSPGSGTITITFSSSSADHQVVTVVQLAASGTITFVNEANGGAATPSNPETATISGYTSGNLNLGFFGGRDQSGTDPAGSETEIGTFAGQVGGTHNAQTVQYITSSASNTFSPGNTAGNRWCSYAALEYSESGGGSTRRIFHIS